jgi:DGQHR domain-containing protein
MRKASKVIVPAIQLTQNSHKFYLCAISAKTLSLIADVSRRDTLADKGYQRLFVESRIVKIKKYLEAGKCIPTAVLVTFKDAKFKNGKITFQANPKKGWIIDGQHRWLGSKEVRTDILLPVIAFLDLPISDQVEHFITINKEAKGVPSSLYLDLLKVLPRDKTPAERAKERATDLARILNSDEESPFYGKIVILTSPKKGELSLTNFVRKIEPIIRKNGPLNKYSPEFQARIFNNYFNAIIEAYPDEADENPPIFFQTLGFGAFMNFLPTLFLSLKGDTKSFTREIIRKSFIEMGPPSFDLWRKSGTGTQAENTATAELENLYGDETNDKDEIDIEL